MQLWPDRTERSLRKKLIFNASLEVHIEHRQLKDLGARSKLSALTKYQQKMQIGYKANPDDIYLKVTEPV